MGCGCRGKKDMSEPQGLYEMKFVGKPNGKLLKGAPGNYIHGVIYKQPFKMSKFSYWQLVEPVPELKVPPASQMDSVYDDAVYVPDDEASVEMLQSMVPEENVNIDPNTGATVEPYMTYEVSSGKLKKYTEKLVQAQPKWETLAVKIPFGVSESPIEEEPEVEEQKETDLTLIRYGAGFPVVPSKETNEENKNWEEASPREEPEKALDRDKLKAILDEKGVKYLKNARTVTLAKMVEALEPQE